MSCSSSSSNLRAVGRSLLAARRELAYASALRAALGHPPDERGEYELHREVHLAAGRHDACSARDMNESWSIESRYGKSMPLGSRKRMTSMLSSGLGMSRDTNGLDVSTMGTRWKFTWVRENCGQM